MSKCILWTGYVDKNGYGKRRFRGRVMKAARAAWIGANGETSDDVHHICTNRRCIRLEHLEAIGRSEHMRITRGVVNGRCQRGHMIVGNSGQCDKCKNQARRIRRAAGSKD